MDRHHHHRKITIETIELKKLETMSQELKDFKILYETHHGFVRQVLFRLLGSKDLDDAVQECFLRVWKARENFKGESAVRSWMYRIATNYAYDVLRAKKPEDSVDPASLDGHQAQPMSDHFLGLEIQKAVSSLPMEYRAVVVAVLFEDLSLKEVSEALEIPEGTVKSRLSRGRDMLKTILTEKGYYDGRS